MEQIFAENISAATIAIAVFGILFSLTQTEFAHVNRRFAVFLAAVAINNVPDVINRSAENSRDFVLFLAEVIIWLPSSFCLAPLFWLYIVSLTSTSQHPSPRYVRHFFLPALALLLGVVLLASPVEVRVALLTGGGLPNSYWAIAVVIFTLMHASVYLQMAGYLILILRRMMQFRLLLRDYYASTEKHELRWIYVIGIFSALFWSARTVSLFIAGETAQQAVQSAILYAAGAASLALVGAMTLWGLRQRPPLVPSALEEELPEPTQDLPAEETNEKYAKSALNTEAASRIARKLRAAMEKDHLYRDPNLSLWILARHIGASPNYISQTLNEVMGESFFDFVNGYRISEAMTLLTTTNASVLTITYDVGFNARSSFYNAFKRVSGQTPTDYRKKMSSPVEVDSSAG